MKTEESIHQHALCEKPEPNRTVGTMRLCAWAVDESSCHIQTNDPSIAKRVARLPDIRLIGYSVTTKFLRLFSTPYTIEWVSKNVVEKITLEFLRKEERGKIQFAPQCVQTEKSTNYTEAAVAA
jgi:hypothetical protein